MCRLAAYLGPPVSLEALLVEPPHSLSTQAWAPEHQVSGVVNADGFGVGWYDPAVRPEPGVHKSARSVWADASFASFAGLVSSPAVVAVVRGTTAPSPVEDSGAQPFTHGAWLFAHNGAVNGFRTGVGSHLRRRLSPERESALLSSTDSEVLFALALDRMADGASAAEALAAVVREVDDLEGGRLNLVLSDGEHLAAIRWGDSLFVRCSAEAVTIASEPFDDDPQWQEVPDRSVVETAPGALSIHPTPKERPT